MVLSYSAAAQPSADTPKVISIASAPEIAGPSSTVAITPALSASSSSTINPPFQSSSTSSAPKAAADTGVPPPQAEAGPSKPRIKHLILDAGPLLSLTPLRHTAEYFYTTPAVVRELRDPKAREWFERLGLGGVDVRVEQPTPEAMARVMAFARKTGDYAVLSATDLGVIALTAQYEIKENGLKNVRSEPVSRAPVAPAAAAPAPSAPASTERDTSTAQTSQEPTAASTSGPRGMSEEGDTEPVTGDATEEQPLQGWYEGDSSDGDEEDDEEPSRDEAASGPGANDDGGDDAPEGVQEAEDQLGSGQPGNSHTTGGSGGQTAESDLAVQANALTLSDPASIPHTITSTSSAPSAPATAPATAAADDIDSESDAGEWITPSNVSKHRSRDLGLLPEGGKNSTQEISAACMTGDFAVQNVLLAMGLGLVGEGGKRIGKVKSWVLRCHACFKVCKDPSKKFCPSCGNPSLLRTSTTTSANGKTHLHLKKNYQYNLRGTKFTIPDAKPGRAKGQLKGGTGLILREDQREWTDAVRKEDIRKGKEEKKILKGWDDPDWLPEIITVGMSGKGRSGAHGLPTIGHGKKNPNISKKKR